MKFFRQLLGISMLIVMAMPLYATQPVKVDLNMSRRTIAEVNEPDYTSWIIQNGPSDVLQLDDLTFTLTSMGDGVLKSNWYKTGIDSAQLANDGVIVSDIPDGSENVSIELKISGLPPGTHSILTYHNQVDNPENNTFAPMDIYFNGQLQKAALEPTVRVASNALAAKFYTEFSIADGEEAVFLLKVVAGSEASNKTVVINGFEIGTSDADAQAVLPVPADRDEHVDADNGLFTLQWTAASGAVSHDVYFGTNRQDVEAAGKASPEYKGNQTTTEYNVSGLYSMETYYWRVDETNNSGAVTKGNVWYFRPRQLAFDGAEGYGRFARGGRGGIVVKVSNLDDSGPGSLRDAVENPAYEGIPRTIVFDVSGRIVLNGRLSVNKPYITIAGQTAPGKGICVSGHAFGIGGVNDVVFRHLRLRVGTDDTTDGMGQSGSNHCIIDHASISWSKDEA
ncbi:MAG: T9SS C-terminal target domain-containing protein, partial [Dysgonamonadaceae bacterium]|nr:T9SS C-terminal target domain-containing protein [Dysgonamonadaceae bacterium]